MYPLITYIFAFLLDTKKKKCSIISLLWYRKVPKFFAARKLPCNLPKILTKRPKHRVLLQKDANGIANSEDPDQTAPFRSSLIRVCTVCKDHLSENLGSLRYVGVIAASEKCEH